MRFFVRFIVRLFSALIIGLLLLEVFVRVVLFLGLNTYLATQIPTKYHEQFKKIDLFSVRSDVKKFDLRCIYLMRDGHFRGPEGQIDVPVAKPAGEIRVLCVGDSTTYGICAEYKDSYPVRLEHMLSEAYPQETIRVLNAGVPGASSRQVKRIFQLYLAEYQADIVIWRKGGCATDTYAVPVLSTTTLKYLLWRVLDELRLFRVICVVIDSSHGRELVWSPSFRDARSFGNKVYDLLFNTVGPDVVGQPFRSDFDMVKAIAFEHGTSHVLAVDCLDRTYSKDGDEIIKTDYADYAKRGCAPVVYTYPVFSDVLQHEAIDEYFVDNCHFTEKGTALLAREVSNYIIAERWIEQIVDVRVG